MTLNLTLLTELCRLFQLFQMNISVISDVFKMSAQGSEKFADESEYSRNRRVKYVNLRTLMSYERNKKPGRGYFIGAALAKASCHY